MTQTIVISHADLRHQQLKESVNRMLANGSDRMAVISLSCSQGLHQHCACTILRCICGCHFRPGGRG